MYTPNNNWCCIDNVYLYYILDLNLTYDIEKYFPTAHITMASLIILSLNWLRCVKKKKNNIFLLLYYSWKIFILFYTLLYITLYKLRPKHIITHIAVACNERGRTNTFAWKGARDGVPVITARNNHHIFCARDFHCTHVYLSTYTLFTRLYRGKK